MRWENYFLKSETDFDPFWRRYLASERNVLFILGVGFDPRTTNGIGHLYNMEGPGLRDTWLLRYFQNEEDKKSHTPPEVADNLSIIHSLLEDKGFPKAEVKGIVLRSPEDISQASIQASGLIQTVEQIAAFSDIVVDISAMPRGIFIPLINKLLHLVDDFNEESDTKKNLHVIATENPLLDAKIEDQGTDETATYIYGFRVKEIGKTEDHKQVWIPILGENQFEQFKKIKSELTPSDTSPVLPFPSEDLRRGDDLIFKFQSLLFNDSDFETKNIIYTDEANPFQTYRLLNETIERYVRSFALLGGCKVVVSALSSKLLTIGTFMAVYEKRKEGHNVGIMHVESLGHRLNGSYQQAKKEIDKHNKLYEIWLAGDPYFA
ncbi:MAG: hypothetical protein EOO01_28545 [Chitinophagaceae bacterium]|nr:MAG: hypothetical protein EOO01_28545 [Chitinophagaceae bacterium]